MGSKTGPSRSMGKATVDCDELRDVPVPHRYIHGHFEEVFDRFLDLDEGPCHVTFSIYLPSADRYLNRFINHMEGGWGGHTDFSQSQPEFMRFALDGCGAYIVESNLGHTFPRLPPSDDLDVHHWIANEAAVRYSREVAAEMYGQDPEYGYLFGISGGGIRTIVGLEHVDDLWDGGVSIVPNITTPDFYGWKTQTAWANLLRVLGPKIDAVIDAMDPGGSGDPFASLEGDEAALMADVIQVGVDPAALFQAVHPFYSVFFPFLMTFPPVWDPSYFQEFWSVPGYAGADGELDDQVIETKVTITRVLTADELAAMGIEADALLALHVFPVAVTVEGLDGSADVRFGSLIAPAGEWKPLTIMAVFGDMLILLARTSEAVDQLRTTNEATISNRNYLAYCHLYKYLPQWGIDAAGDMPMRTAHQDPIAPTMTGKFHGKLIVSSNAWDINSTVAGGLRYQELVDAAGNADRFRFWCVANATHMPPAMVQGAPEQPPVFLTRASDYRGHAEQAVLDLIEWVEHGVEPPRGTQYSYDDGVLSLPDAAAERGGIQPVVSAFAAGQERADVKAGTPVALRCVAEAPPGTGMIVSAEWDFDGSGSWPYAHADLGGAETRAAIDVVVTHTFDAPGTYFPAVRVQSHRDGLIDAPFGRSENIARVRVVVTD